MEAEGDSKYSWCQEEHQQKGQPHGDGDAEASAERVSSGKCEPSHAAEEEMSGEGDCSGGDSFKIFFLPFFVCFFLSFFYKSANCRIPFVEVMF